MIGRNFIGVDDGIEYVELANKRTSLNTLDIITDLF